MEPPPLSGEWVQRRLARSRPAARSLWPLPPRRRCLVTQQPQALAGWNLWPRSARSQSRPPGVANLVRLFQWPLRIFWAASFLQNYIGYRQSRDGNVLESHRCISTISSIIIFSFAIRQLHMFWSFKQLALPEPSQAYRNRFLSSQPHCNARTTSGLNVANKPSECAHRPPSRYFVSATQRPNTPTNVPKGLNSRGVLYRIGTQIAAWDCRNTPAAIMPFCLWECGLHRGWLLTAGRHSKRW